MTVLPASELRSILTVLSYLYKCVIFMPVIYLFHLVVIAVDSVLPRTVLHTHCTVILYKCVIFIAIIYCEPVWPSGKALGW